MKHKINHILFAAALCLAGIGAVAMPASAADSGKKDSGGGLISQRTYNQIEQIQKLSEKEQYDKAIAAAKELLGNVGSDYEKAVVMQQMAYLYVYKDDYKTGAKYLSDALDLNVFSDQETSDATIALAQIYFAMGSYQKSLDLLTKWLPKAKDPPPQAYMYAATSYAQLERYRDALPYAKKAIDLAKAKNKPIEEDWYSVLASIYTQLKQYRNAAGVLEILVASYPHKYEYWQTLSSIYMELDEDRKALSTLALAYKQGLVDNQGDLLRLAQLYMLDDQPYPASQVMQKGLADGKIKANSEHYEYLANTLIAAKEYRDATDALAKAAPLAKNGELWLRQAQVFAQMHDWPNVVKAVDKATDKGDLKHPGNAYILKGMAAAEAKNVDAALSAFKHAERFKDTKRQASDWIHYVNDQVKPLVEK